MEAESRRIFVEVKGVTLEQDGIARFPDAPTERGVKHLRELISCRKDGFEAYVVFVIQMRAVRHFEPNWETHPAFGEALLAAQRAGVRILALSCDVTECSITARDFVPVRIERPRPGR
jgi:sugar fermentation stimulation protein A